MHDVQRGARAGRVCQDFLQGSDRAARFDRSGVPHMNVVRHAALGRESEKIEHLGPRRRRHVVDAEADAERTFVQALFDKVGDLADLVGRGDSVDRVVTWEEVCRCLSSRPSSPGCGRPSRRS